MASPKVLPIGDRTDITTEADITFCSTPIHIRLQNASQDTTIESAIVYLWIWNGNQNAVLGNPNFTFNKIKISADDTYINFQIADQIRSFLESPANAPNTYQPQFAYNELSNPTITGQGVFWQIVTDITSSGVTVRNNYTTAFATLGWRWNYEQNSIGNNGVANGGSTGFVNSINRWYNPRIHNYISQSFNFALTVATANTSNMIIVTDVTPSSIWERCSRDGVLIVFVNKIGLFEMFTPNGKFTASTKVEREISNKAFRDPALIDNTYIHSKATNSLDVAQSYVVNTGSLIENMDTIIEELIYSPKVYLIKFKGDVQETTTVGITVDNTFITVDDTNITVDSSTVGQESIGFYKTHQQIPVMVKNSNFVRKTSVNDKNDINFDIQFIETNNKINSIL